MADKAPLIVPISELRRDTSRLVRRVQRSHLPLFVTQRGYVSAVLLSREEYDTMCVLRDKGIKSLNPYVLLHDRLPSVREAEEQPEYWNDW